MWEFWGAEPTTKVQAMARSAGARPRVAPVGSGPPVQGASTTSVLSGGAAWESTASSSPGLPWSRGPACCAQCEGQEDEVPEGLEAVGSSGSVPGRVPWAATGSWACGLVHVEVPALASYGPVVSGVVRYFWTLYVLVVPSPWSSGGGRPGRQGGSSLVPSPIPGPRLPSSTATADFRRDVSLGSVLGLSWEPGLGLVAASR